MKRGQETLMLNAVMEAVESMTLASDMKLLLFLSRHRGYRGNTFSTKQLAIALEIDLRTTQSGTTRLAGLGYIVSAEGHHCSAEAQSKMPQGYCKALASLMQASNKSTRAVPPLEPRQDAENEPLNLKNFRTDELMNKEQQQDAQESAALVGTSPSQESVPETNTPPIASEINAPAFETVPRRRAPAAEMPAMPVALAALPGLTEAWGEWLTYRKQRHLPTAPATAQGMFVKLAEFHADGHDPAGVIHNSISNGWQGLFPPRAAHVVRFQPKTTEEANDRVRNRAAELYAALKGVKNVF